MIFKNNSEYLMKYSCIAIVLQLFFVGCQTYTIPTPTAKTLSPKGFRISISGKFKCVFCSFGRYDIKY